MTQRRTLLRRVGGLGVALTAGCLGETGAWARTTRTGTGATKGTGTANATGTPNATGNGTTTVDGTANATHGPGTSTNGSRSCVTGTATSTGGAVVDVAVGPDGRLRFVPETVEISVGDTVRWTFESPGHNVTSKPGASEKVRNPAGAEPFASYEGTQHYAIRPVGDTYEHTFTVAGEYIYVCEPHADQGMVATVVVTA